MAELGISEQIAEAERELERAREAMAAAGGRFRELATSGAAEAAVEAAQAQRDEAVWKAERIELRIEGLKARRAEVEAEERRAADVALAARLAGWREAFLEASRDCDRLMAELAEALERRAACAKEIMACAPVELRDVGRHLMPVAIARAAAGPLGAYLPLTHPWHDRRHWGALADPGAMPEVDRVLERLRGEQRAESEAA